MYRRYRDQYDHRAASWGWKIRRHLASARTCQLSGQTTVASCVDSNRTPRFRPFSTAAIPNDKTGLLTKTDQYGGDISSNQTVIPYLLADIGEGIAEVELMQWFVAPGDEVSQFDRICEVQSDKATVEITSRYDGVVQSLEGNIGDMVSVGSPLLHISLESETSYPCRSQPSQNASIKEKDMENVDNSADNLHLPSPELTFDGSVEECRGLQNGKFLASPAVRKLGRENKLDLSTISGTGPKGRVLKLDVLRVLKNLEHRPEDLGLVDDAGDKSGSSMGQTSVPLSAGPLLLQQHHMSDEADEVVPIRGYNRSMLKSMTSSLQIPHMCFSDEVNMNSLLEYRKLVTDETTGAKLSVLPFAIKAASMSLQKFPIMNSTLNEDEATLTLRHNHNIGVAMDTPRGLAVPVVKNCEARSILDIAADLKRLKTAASSGVLSEEDVRGATFSLSNIGALGGGTYMQAVVVPPQVAIGAMGRVQRLPRFLDDTSNEVEAVNVMQISWSGDHRVVDGATLARFSNTWKAYMENPVTMLFGLK